MPLLESSSFKFKKKKLVKNIVSLVKFTFSLICLGGLFCRNFTTGPKIWYTYMYDLKSQILYTRISGEIISGEIKIKST